MADKIKFTPFPENTDRPVTIPSILLDEMIDYIETNVANMDEAFSHARDTDQIIKDGKMPKIWHALMILKNGDSINQP